MLVVNASNIEKDWNWVKSHNKDIGADIENISDEISLLAPRPKASALLQQLTPTDLSSIKFYHFEIGEMAGIKDVIISATGYTGSGGFELYVKNNDAEKLWENIMKVGESYGLLPAGLAARDTLRLEMGYCLWK